ncbi:hypothetical protein [Luteimonas lutimaris]|uniref:Lipoprotein n=1 Tax=Luteimonas lutimaris TaxID=698645 RepID=A0ABP7M1T5_9GAMM|nr:hypothetical protein [Luteimonas sp.]
MKKLSLLACTLLLVACSGRLKGEGMGAHQDFDAAWQAVQAAGTAEDQRREIDAFLSMNQQAGAPPLQVNVRRRDSGEAAPIDQALWDHPGEYEVVLRYGDRKYPFVPKSRSSLEPLFRE